MEKDVKFSIHIYKRAKIEYLYTTVKYTTCTETCKLLSFPARVLSNVIKTKHTHINHNKRHHFQEFIARKLLHSAQALSKE